MEEGTTLYRGWGWTMARNAPGSFAVRIFFSPITSYKLETDNLIETLPSPSPFIFGISY
jgi:hypothetical protein